MPTLTIVSGPQKGLSYQAPPEKITIGRDSSNELHLEGKKLSRHHAMLEPDGDRWLLTDLGSRNGTLVNGEAIKEYHLRPRDEIQIGDIVIVFMAEGGPDQAEPADSAMQQRILEETLISEDSEILGSEELGTDVSKARRLNDRLRALVDLTRKVGAAHSPDELLDGLGAAVEASLGPDRVVPLIVSDDGSLQPWTFQRSGLPPNIAEMPISQSIVEHARERLAGVLTVNASADERFGGAASIRINQIATAMCVPILYKGELKGLLYVDRLGEAQSFSHEDLETLTAIGLCLAAPLENVSFCDRVNREKDALAQEVRQQHSLIGESAPMQSVYTFIERAAAASTDACVLILGESGTGKELVARGVHYNSARSAGPLEVVNCAALNHSLMDSELFGHAKGAFTDAREERPGRFELADRGTIFLDEIGELTEGCQSKLLRVLETGELRRLGDTADRHVDIRVIAATNRDLQEEIKNGSFREDLFYRLNVLRIELPPLRQRPGDLEILAESFLRDFGHKCGRPELAFAPEVKAALKDYHWPGNVRELKNIIERMVVMSASQVLTIEDVPAEMRGPAPAPVPVPAEPGSIEPLGTLAELEKVHIQRVLEHTQGNKKEAARVLGIDRSTLYARLKTYGIDA